LQIIPQGYKPTKTRMWKLCRIKDMISFTIEKKEGRRKRGETNKQKRHTNQT
jgi:hypothetical protein